MVKEKAEKGITIKGIGLMTAVTIIAETNGFNLILNKKQLVSYAGLDVKEKPPGYLLSLHQEYPKQETLT